LKIGSNGEAVQTLKERLVELGYMEDFSNDKYDEKTKEAVRAFQVRNDLPADGIAGEDTLSLLFSEKARQQVWVWIPTHGGTKYHGSSGCSKMIDPIRITLEEAHKRGYDACGRCY
jgi:peptidoglycan hydrolase-like protein with peptidoglycan-binding domain